jgi:hypothetical protein
VRPEAVELIEDRSHGMVRTEVRCANCGSHLGRLPRRVRHADRRPILHELAVALVLTRVVSDAASRPALEAVRQRRSWSKVTDAAPTRAELVTLVSAAGRVADHSSLRPWRVIELRGDDRLALGAAIAAAQGDSSPSTKPLRAPLLVAIVASYRKSDKVPRWEQEAVASGVAHTLSLLLDEAGWGVIWRTGHYTRSAPSRPPTD